MRFDADRSSVVSIRTLKDCRHQRQHEMAKADEQIRVSGDLKARLESMKREGESYNDVLERVLDEERVGDFYDGFGRWSDEEAERVREGRRKSKEKRKERLRERAEDAA
jgi:predicted CopG family antitoxin